MSFGKLITQPLLLLATLAIVLILFALKRTEDRRARVSLIFALAAVVSLLVLAVPMVGWMLERIVLVDSEAIRAPDVIVVAGGGYGYSTSGGFRPISGESVARVVQAVEWWESNRDAILVMAGEAATDPGPVPMAAQMKEIAVARGVPASQVLLERVSRSTREHPVALREVIGIPSETPVGIVTSRWHLRRARREFRRYYARVAVPPTTREGPRLTSLRLWFPQTDALSYSTAIIHEMIGIAWSELVFRLFGPPELNRPDGPVTPRERL